MKIYKIFSKTINDISPYLRYGTFFSLILPIIFFILFLPVSLLLSWIYEGTISLFFIYYTVIGILAWEFMPGWILGIIFLVNFFLIRREFSRTPKDKFIMIMTNNLSLIPFITLLLFAFMCFIAITIHPPS